MSVTPSTALKTDRDRATAERPPRDLRAHAARSRKQQNRLAIALVIVMGLGAMAVYVPLRRTIEQTRQNIATSEAELAANRDRASTLPQLIQTVNGLRKQVDQYKPLRSATDLDLAMKELSDIKESTRPDNYRFDGKSTEIRHASCIERPLKLTFDADFIDAVSFISKVESMDRLTRLRELSVKRLGNGLTNKGGKVTVTMSLSLFYAAADGSEQP